MRCKEARKNLLRSMDGRLPEGRRDELANHVAACPGCRAFGRDGGEMLGLLKEGREPEPLPYFQERLWAKIAEREKSEFGAVWMRWSLRAIPVALALIAVFIGALVFIGPPLDEDMSMPAALLIKNANPLAETNALFNEDKTENKNMMIIFAGNEIVPARRYQP
jgi:predicted anti-sigma-YlaC factor YlaD